MYLSLRVPLRYNVCVGVCVVCVYASIFLGAIRNYQVGACMHSMLQTSTSKSEKDYEIPVAAVHIWPPMFPTLSQTK